VLSECVDERAWSGDHGPATTVRLRLGEDQALAGHSMETATDREPTNDEVDVAPLQCERLRLTQPERKRDGPTRRVAPTFSGGKHALAFVDVERLGCLRSLLAWRFDERGDVARDAITLHRDLECPAQHAVDRSTVVGGPVSRIFVYACSRCSGISWSNRRLPMCGTTCIRIMLR
jgi:hypothetical protein